MPGKQIVVGQPVSRVMLERSIDLRHAMTPAEQKLWQRLKANRLGGFHFRRQQVIGNYIVSIMFYQLSWMHVRREANEHAHRRLIHRRICSVGRIARNTK